ncbi:MAG: Ig-like domain-containing protein [Cyclobacteriaceae bacterium]
MKKIYSAKQLINLSTTSRSMLKASLVPRVQARINIVKKLRDFSIILSTFIVFFFLLSTDAQAQPTFTATWLDANPTNGTIDQLQLDFSENVDIVDFGGAINGFLAITISGGAITIDNADYNSGAPTSQLVLNVSGVVGTSDPGVTISYSDATTSSIIGNPSSLEVLNASNPTATVDGASPTASAPISGAETLRGGVTSTSTVQSTEAGAIYLVLNGVSATSQSEIDAAILANNAFLGEGSATAGNPFTVTPGGALNDGVYDIYAVDAAGNVSVGVGGWLTVDNTSPSAFSINSATSLTNTVVSGYYNATNSGVDVEVPIENESSLTGGSVQIRARVSTESYADVESSVTIAGGDLGNTITVTVLDATIAGLTNFADGATLNFTAVISDVAGNTTTGTTSQDLDVDETAPTASAPMNGAESLRGGVTSTSTVQSTEAGAIYLVLNGVSATSQSEIDAAVLANNAFLGEGSATAGNPFTVTPGGALNNGIYDIYAIDAAGNVSAGVGGWLTVDNTAPTASAPTNGAETLRGGVTSTSTVQSTEAGAIYLVLNGVSATSQSEIDAAVLANNAFLGEGSATAGNPFTVTPGGALNDGVYDIYAVDAAGNVSVGVGGWLTVDNTSPSAFSINSASSLTNTIVSGYYNATNSGVDVEVPIENESSLIGGSVQIRARVSTESYVDVESSVTIAGGDLGNTITITVSDATIVGLTNFADGVTLNFTAVISDIAGNTATGTTSQDLDVDETNPTITAHTATDLETNNAYVDVNFPGGVFGSGAVALTTADFTIFDFQANGGTATNVVIADVTDLSDLALTGGESDIRFVLSVSGTPDGNETFEIRPTSASSVFDLAGNALSGTATTNPITLKVITGAVEFVAATTSSDNTSVLIEFSEAVDRQSGNTTNPLRYKDNEGDELDDVAGSNANNLTDPDGDGNTITISNDELVESDALGVALGGNPNTSAYWGLTISVSGPPTSGNESFTLFPPDGAEIYASAAPGTKAMSDDQIITVFLADQVPPTVTAGNISVTSSGSGAGGLYLIGDKITAQWDNSATGENNADAVTAVTFDFSEFEGGVAVPAVETSGVWEASYDIVSGTVDASGLNVFVTATDDASNSNTPTEGTDNLSMDNDDPDINTFSPIHTAAGVATDSDIILTFDQAVTAGIGTISLSTAGQVQNIQANNSTYVSVSGNTVTIVAPSAFLESQVYEVTIDNKAFDDASGNDFSGLDSPNYTFTTGVDNEGPRLTITVDEPNTGTVSSTSDDQIIFILDFDEEIQSINPGTDITLGGTLGGSASIDDFNQISATRYTVTVTDLNSDGTILINIDNTSGDILDNSGNAFVGPDAGGSQDSPTVTIDKTKPILTIDTSGLSTNDETPPLSGSINENLPVNVFVNGNDYAATISGVGPYTWSIADNTIATLPEGTYTVVVTASDEAENEGGGSASLNVDLTKPTITVAYYFDVDNDGSIDEIAFFFSEDIDDATFSVNDFTISGATSQSFGTNITISNSLDGITSLGVGGTVNDQWLTIEVDDAESGTGILGTAVGTVTYVAGTGADLVGNTLDTNTEIIESDRANPIVIQSHQFDTDANGDIDEVVIEFSEGIRYASVSNTEYTINGLVGDGDLGDPEKTLHTDVSNTLDAESSDEFITFQVGVTGTATVPVSFTRTSTVDLATRAAISNLSITEVDQADPVVTSVNSLSTNSGGVDPAYIIGESISIQLTFSEVVDVSGIPTLTLETGAVDRIINYASGTNSSELTFDYTVQSGDESDDLDYVDSNSLTINSVGGITIEDQSGNTNEANTTLPSPGAANSLGANKALVVDGVLPTFVNATEYDINADGDIDEILIEMSEDVSVAVFEVADFVLGTGTVSAISDVAGSSANIGNGSDISDTDQYITLEVTDIGSTEAVSLAYSLVGAFNVSDLGGNEAVANPAITVVDVALPRVLDVTSASNGLFGIGATIPLQVVFSETVNVTNPGVLDPTLRLETGTFDQIVDMTSGSGSNTLVFNYTIQEGDVAADLNYVNSNTSLLSNEATISDAAANTAINVLPTIVGTGGDDLASNNNIEVDGVRPELTKAWQYDVDGNGDIDEIVIEVSEEVDETPSSAVSSDFALSSGSISQISTNGGTDDVQNTLDANDADQYVTLEVSVTGSATVTVSYTQGTLADLAGNLASSDASITVDDQAVPIVKNVTSSVANTSYNAGDIIPIQVTFSEPVTVSGTPQLTLETGTTDEVIDLTSGSGSSILTYDYTVQAGDVTSDLDYISTGALQLNGGSINDQSLNANAADLTLAAPSSTNSLGDNKEIIIDTQIPTVTALSIATVSGSDALAKGDDPDSGLDSPDRVVITMDFSDDLLSDPIVVFKSGGFFVSGAVTLTEIDAVNEIWTAYYDVDRDDANGAVTFTVNFTDKAGNPGVEVDESDITDASSMTIDNTNPTVAFSVTESPTRSDPFIVTATMSESVIGLAISDFSITTGNGTIANFLNPSTDVYTFEVNPTDNQTAIITVRMTDEGVTDVAGNSISETDFSVNFDDEAPVLTHSEVIFGRDLTLTLSQSEVGKIYYAVVPDGQAGVTNATVKAGTVPNTIAGGSGTIDATAAGVDYIVDLSLDADRTNYDLYLVTEDEVQPGSNLSTLTLVDITSGGVIVTAPSLSDFCLEGDFFSLDDIVITETIETDFVNSGANRTLRLELPDVNGDDIADFEFNTAVTPVFSDNGGDVDAISTSYIGTTVLSLIYTNNNLTAALDVLTISGLQISATGSVTGSSSILRSGGNGNIYLANDGDGTVFGSLTTISPYDAPEIVTSASPNPYILEIASGILEIAVGSSANGLEDGVTVYNKDDFALTLTPMTIGLPSQDDVVNIYSDASLTTLVDSYTAVSNSDTYTPTLSDLGFASADASIGITTFWITVEDGSTTSSCESVATKFSVAVIRLENSSGSTAFSVDDGAGTTFKFTYPSGYSSIYSGDGLTGLNLNDDFTVPTEDGSSIRFIPSATSEGRSVISYALTNIANGVTATYSVEVFVVNADQVLASSPSQEVNYCQYDMSAMLTMVGPSGVDYVGDSDGDDENPDFFTIKVYDFTGDIRGTELTSTVLTTIPTSTSGNPNTLTGWNFDPTTLDGQLVGTVYSIPLEFVYFVKDEITDAEIELATEIITIYREPTVTITNINQYYCNDDGDFDISSQIISAEGTMEGSILAYQLQKHDGTDYQNVGGVRTTANFNPADPDDDGNEYPTEEEFGLYRIVYTSPDLTDASCNSTIQVDFEILEIPALPLMDESSFAGISDGDNSGYLLEYCEGETVGSLTVNVSGTDMINWYNNSDGSSPISSANISGSNNETLDVASAFFGNNDEPTGRQTKIFYYTITDNIGVNATSFAGCESETKQIRIEIYPDPILPVVTTLVDGMGVTNAFNSDLDESEYVFEYCVTDGQAVTLNDIVVDASLNTEVFAESYYNIYDETQTLVDTYHSGLVTDDFVLVDSDFKSNYFTFSAIDSTQLVFYISQTDYDNNFPSGSSQFIGCESSLRKFTIDINVIPNAPDPDEFNGFNEAGIVSYYVCSGEDLSTITTPQTSGSEYRWYRDNSGSPETTPITVDAFNDVFVVQSELETVGLDINMAGTYTYWVSQVTESNSATGFAGCESSATQVDITVFPDPTTPNLTINSSATSEISYCVGGLEDALFEVSNVSPNAIIRWYAADENRNVIISTPESTTLANNNGQDTVTAEDLRILTANEGTRYFLVSQENDSIQSGSEIIFSGCETEFSDMQFVTINVFKVPPAPETVSGKTLFGEDEVNENGVSIIGEGHAGEKFIWYFDRNEDGTLDSIHSGSSATSAQLNLPDTVGNGRYKFHVSQIQDIGEGVSDFQGCESPLLELFVFMVPPAPNATNPNPQCDNNVTDNSTIIIYSGVENIIGGSTFKWYAKSTDNVEENEVPVTKPDSDNEFIIADINNLAINGLMVDTTVYVSQVINIGANLAGATFDGIEGERTEVTIIVYPQPESPDTPGSGPDLVINDFDFCEQLADPSSEIIAITSVNPGAQYVWYPNEFLDESEALDTATSITLAQLNGEVLELLDGSEKQLNIASDIEIEEVYAIYVTEVNSIIDGFSGCASEPTQILLYKQPKAEDVSFGDVTTDEEIFNFEKYCYDYGDILIGAEVTINGESDIANTGVYSINTGGLIDNGDGTALLNTQSMAAALGTDRVGVTTTHIISYTYTSVWGCEETFTLTLHVEPHPDISFTIENAEGSEVLGSALSSDSYFMSVRDLNVDLMSYDLDTDFSINGGTFSGDGVGITTGGAAPFDPDRTDGSGAKDDLYSAAETFGINYSYSDINGCQNDIAKSITVLPIPDFYDHDRGGASNEQNIESVQACLTQEIILQTSISNLDIEGLGISIDDVTFSWSGANPGANSTPLTNENFPNANIIIENINDSTNQIRFTNALSDDFDDLINEGYPKLDGNVTFQVQASYNFITGTTQPDLEIFANSQEEIIAIGFTPQPRFRWDNTTVGSTTVFELSDASNSPVAINDIAFEVYNLSDLTVRIDSIGRDDGTHSSEDIKLDWSYIFPSAGDFLVRITYNSTSSCDALEERIVTINDIITIPNGGSMTHRFEGDTEGWYLDSIDYQSAKAGFTNYDSTSLSQPSWEIGTTATFGDGNTSNFWVTDADSTYNINEQSIVFSPTYDLSAMSLPTISFDFAADLDLRDGVVFQYSLDDGVSWSTLGDFSSTNGTSGRNWYNTLGINSNPGNADDISKFDASNIPDEFNPNVFGWNLAGKQVGSDEERVPEWQKAAHKLDVDGISVEDRRHIRFRFSLGSSAGEKITSETERFEGFAFDNVKIFDREKLIVLEQFSSLELPTSRRADTTIYGLIARDLGSDALLVNYYTALVEDPDELNERNTNDPGARAAYYGISEAPRSVIAGSIQEPDGAADGFELQTMGWNVNRFNETSLGESLFDISNVTIGGSSQEIVVESVDFTSRVNLPDSTELAFRFAVVESKIYDQEINTTYQVDTIYNALRKMLPSAGGFAYVGRLDSGDTNFGIDLTETKWGISSVYDASQLKVIIFVQLDSDLSDELGLAKGTILQAAQVDVGAGKINPTPETITANQLIAGKEFGVYPNPSDESFEIELVQETLMDMDWVLYDQSGREALKGTIAKGSKNATVTSKDLSSGIYMLHVFNDAIKWNPKRVIVVH